MSDPWAKSGVIPEHRDKSKLSTAKCNSKLKWKQNKQNQKILPQTFALRPLTQQSIEAISTQGQLCHSLCRAIYIRFLQD